MAAAAADGFHLAQGLRVIIGRTGKSDEVGAAAGDDIGRADAPEAARQRGCRTQGLVHGEAGFEEEEHLVDERAAVGHAVTSRIRSGDEQAAKLRRLADMFQVRIDDAISVADARALLK